MAKKTKEKVEHKYEIRDIVLGKVKGFPPWPGMVVDPEGVPKNVAKERPSKTTVFCVRFFPAGDHSWLVPKEISPLQKHEIEAFIAQPSKKSGELLKGYKIAQDPVTWEEEKKKSAAEEEEAEMNAEIDQLDGEEDAAADGDDGEEKKPGRKRKRESESKASTKKKGGKDSDGGEKKKRGRRSTKKNGISNETVESEDDGADDKDLSPAAKRAKRDKDEDDEKFAHLKNDPEATRIKAVRHQLQKAFLGKTGPLEAEMLESDTVFKDLESKDISIEYLSYSKIGKVMRHIASLDAITIPRDGEFNFRERAGQLVVKWHKVLGSKAGVNGADGDGKAGTDGEADN